MQLVLWIFALFSVTYAVHSPLFTEFEWKYFDYVWKSQEHKNYYLRNGLYAPKNLTPIDVDRTIDGRTFVTIIKDYGVPASLNTISTIRGESGPLLRPYPDWSWYERNDCNGIISVYRVAIDKCNRMWVLDNGKVGNDYACPAKLLAFNLYTDKLLFKIDIADNIAYARNGEGLLVTPIVETYGDTCQNTTVYMSDVQGFGLVIWNGYRLYRLEADVFEPELRNSDFSIAGQTFHLEDGILFMSLSPIQYRGGNRYLSFRPMASKSLYAADTQVLKRSYDGRKIKYYKGIDIFPSQVSGQVFSSDGTLFYALTTETALGCWNMKKPLSREYFTTLVTDNQRLQFASSLKIVQNPLFFPQQDEQLLIMTNRLQKVFTGTLDLNEINFRIMRASVRELKRGTICDC